MKKEAFGEQDADGAAVDAIKSPSMHLLCLSALLLRSRATTISSNPSRNLAENFYSQYDKSNERKLDADQE